MARAGRPQATNVAACRAGAESDIERLRRLLAFVARQEPRLNWAVGDHADGTTVLVTDLAHGWIPPGITLAGRRAVVGTRAAHRQNVRPNRRSRRASRPTRPAIRCAGRLTSPRRESSLQPRELPAVEDLGWQLSRATHWRDGLPRMVHTLAKAAAAGTGVVEQRSRSCCGCISIRRVTGCWRSIRTSIPRSCSTACCWPPPKASSAATRYRRTTTSPGFAELRPPRRRA